jgi:hypothetical protein
MDRRKSCRWLGRRVDGPEVIFGEPSNQAAGFEDDGPMSFMIVVALQKQVTNPDELKGPKKTSRAWMTLSRRRETRKAFSGVLVFVR